MTSPLATCLAALLFVSATACSSNNSNGTSPTYSVTSCPNKVGATAACDSCLEASCTSQASAVNSACADVIACNCPAGSDAAACPTQSTACDTATAQFLACGLAACASACGAASDAGAADGG